MVLGDDRKCKKGEKLSLCSFDFQIERYSSMCLANHELFCFRDYVPIRGQCRVIWLVGPCQRSSEVDHVGTAFRS